MRIKGITPGEKFSKHSLTPAVLVEVEVATQFPEEGLGIQVETSSSTKTAGVSECGLHCCAVDFVPSLS